MLPKKDVLTRILMTLLLILLFPNLSFGIASGDVNLSGKIDLGDVVLSLQLIAGSDVQINSGNLTEIDINDDLMIGLEEALFVLQVLADLRSILIDKTSVSIPEGGTAGFQVKLSNQPSDTVTVNVNRTSGDADISVQSGSTLHFTTSDWGIYQPVTLSALEDIDVTDGSAVITVSSSGLTSHTVSATEEDNDVLTIVTDATSVSIHEGGTAGFQVKLSNQPSDTVPVNVNRTSGDADISVQSGSTLHFTTSDWGIYQPVTLSAEEDSDDLDGSAVITLSSSGLISKTITAMEVDQGLLNCVQNEIPDQTCSNAAGWIYTFNENTFSHSANINCYTVSNAPSWLNFDSATRIFDITPTSATQGTYADIQVTAHYSSGTPLEVTDKFDLTVDP